LAYQGVLEPIRNDSAIEVHHNDSVVEVHHESAVEVHHNESAVEVHQNYEQITKVTWYQTKSGHILQSKHSAQQRNYKTNLHSKKKANAAFVTDNRICKPVMKFNIHGSVHLSMTQDK
jgi:hypothetical protein